MTEYIKREYAVDAVLDVYCDTPDIDLSCEKFEAAIFKIPPADVVPVRHGMWVYAKTYYDADECNCSLCGQLMTTAINKRMNYCPNCGAKMGGET